MERKDSAISVPDEIRNRKGAVRAADIPDRVKELLNSGVIESVNLMEWLAVDHEELLQHVLPSLGLSHLVDTMLQEVDKLKEKKAMKTIALIGKLLYEALIKESEENRTGWMNELATHPSDSVRCWVCYMIGANPALSLEQKLEQIKPFAADKHFGVREISWMAVRDVLAEDIVAAIALLKDWTRDEDQNIRRFAVEATRPKGVWTRQIQVLKDKPELAASLLEPLKSDPSKYVQDSVGNWLNDASKSRPEWVLKVCEQWKLASNSRETEKIIAKAIRTIMKTKR